MMEFAFEVVMEQYSARVEQRMKRLFQSLS
jgi:hypothetical protein